MPQLHSWSEAAVLALLTGEVDSAVDDEIIMSDDSWPSSFRGRIGISARAGRWLDSHAYARNPDGTLPFGAFVLVVVEPDR